MTTKTKRQWFGVMTLFLAVGIANRVARHELLADPAPCIDGCGKGAVSLGPGSYDSDDCEGDCYWVICTDEQQPCQGSPYVQADCGLVDCHK